MLLIQELQNRGEVKSKKAAEILNSAFKKISGGQTELNVSLSYIHDIGAKILSIIVSGRIQLTSVDVSLCGIRQQGMALLCNALKYCINLRKLILGSMTGGYKWNPKLFPNIDRNYLTIFIGYYNEGDLWAKMGNTIDGSGVYSVSELIKNLKFLQIIALDYCNTKVLDQKLILEAINKSDSISEIYIGDYDINQAKTTLGRRSIAYFSRNSP